MGADEKGAAKDSEEVDRVGLIMTDFIEALKHFVNVEYDTQVMQVRAMWRQPLSVRVAEGEAIADVEIVDVTRNMARLRCRENLSKFRVGDTLLLNRGRPLAGGFSCVLEEERGDELIVSAGYNVSFAGLPPGPGWVLDRAIVDVRHILLGALDTLDFISQQAPPSGGRLARWLRRGRSSDDTQGNKVLDILKGRIRPRIDRRRERHGLRLAKDLGLNASQSEAFARAYATENYYLIQGPPGTGKTWVLAHLAKTLAEEGQRVLVTAFTHRAINNALRKVADVKCPHVFKVGQARYADDLSKDGLHVPNFERFDHSPYRTAEGGYVVGGTCFAVRTSRLRGIQFDTVIFDEAGQVTLPLAIAGMLSGRRYIFIGDHKQMAPVIVGQHRERWVTRSVFETLFAYAPGTMLGITYRMNTEINDFPSKRFYEGRLQPASEVRGRRLRLNRRPRRYAQLLDPGHPSVFAEVRHAHRGMRAPEEAELAAALVAEAMACGVPPREIAVVAPYRAQGRLIRQRLQELVPGISSDGASEIVVDTVERIQGQERDLVIISLTTSDPGHAAQRAAFYFQPNRLNVAITRPRVKRIIIGSPLLFRAQPAEPEHRAWVEHFRALYRESQVILTQTGAI